MPEEQKQMQDPLNFLRVSQTIEKDEPIEPKEDGKEVVKKEKEKGSSDSAKILRQERDALKAKLVEAEEKLKNAKIPEELAPLEKVANYIKSKKGKIDENAVDEYISKNRERKAKLSEYDKTLKEKEDLVRNLNIEASEDWAEFKRKAKKAEDSLLATIAEVDDKGVVKNPELIQKLYSALLQRKEDGSTINAIEAKGILANFAKAWEKQTGNVYEIPEIGKVVREVESLVGVINEAQSVKKDWEGFQKKKKLEQEFELSKKQKELNEIEIRARAKLRTSIISAIDEDAFHGSFEREEIESVYTEQFDNWDKILVGEKEPMPAREVMEKLAKGSMFDELLNRYKQLLESIKSDKGLSRSSIKKKVTEEPANEEQRKVPTEDPLSIFHK